MLVKDYSIVLEKKSMPKLNQMRLVPLRIGRSFVSFFSFPHKTPSKPSKDKMSWYEIFLCLRAVVFVRGSFKT